MSSKEKITKYYKINISEKDGGINDYKCYKVLRQSDKVITIGYDLDDVIRDLSYLKSSKQVSSSDSMMSFLNIVEVGMVSFFLLNFLVKFI